MIAGSDRLIELFFGALELRSDSERAQFLSEACSGDERLRRRVEELLRAHDDAGNFILEPHPAVGGGLQAAAALDDIGTRIGHYRLVRRLGNGGMGSVYEAEQTSPVRRHVALKLIIPGMDTREVLGRFEAERQTLALMDHPHIARVLDAGATEGGRPYFVMELVNGPPLTEYCDHRQLGIRARLKLFVQVCRAVQHAHQKGILHRDIKPTNILVVEQDGEPVPKVIDFGIAKALHHQLTDNTMLTRPAQLVGTPMYMSPEQADPAISDVDTRTDVYSLGVVLYELLAGTTPFDRDRIRRANPDELRRIISDEDPNRPSVRVTQLGENSSTTCAARKCDPQQLRSLLRGELDWIVMKALEKDRTRRYESVSALAADIERYLADEPVLACPPSRTYLLRKSARRHRTLLTTMLLVSAALCIGTAVAIWQACRASAAEHVAQTERDRALRSERSAERERDRALQSEMETRRMLYAADVRLAADAWKNNDIARMHQALSRQQPQPGDPDFRGFEWYYLWQQTGLTSRPLIDGIAPLYFAAFSPDARWLAIAGADGIIHLFDGSSYAPVGTIDSGQMEVNGLAFAPDSRTVASAGDDGTVALWDVDTRQRRLTIRAHETVAFQVAFSPEGSTVISCANEPGIRVWDALTGESRGTLERHTETVDAIAVGPGELLVAGSEDLGASLWNLQTRECVWFGSGADRTAPQSVAISADGRLLAVGRANAVVTVRETAQPERIVLQHALTDMINSVAFSPDGRWLAVGDSSGDVTLLSVPGDASTPNAGSPGQFQHGMRTWHAHEDRLYGLSFAPGGRELITVSKDGRAKVWVVELSGSQQVVATAARHCAFLPDGRLLTCGDDLCLQNLTADGVSHRLEPASGRWGWVSAAGTGTICARHQADNAIHAWDTSGTPLGSLWQGSGPTGAVRFEISPDATRLAIQEQDGNGNWSVNLFDCATQTTLSQTPAVASIGLAFAPDGSLLAFSRSKEVVVLDARTGSVRHVLEGHRTTARGLAFSPDGRSLASVGGDRRLIVWDTFGGTPRWSVIAHALGATDVAYAPDGRTLATIGEDGVLRLWHAELQQLLLEIPLSFDPVAQVEFSPDGRRLLRRHKSGQVVVFSATGDDD